ncbi:MAG: hypothetical protein AAF488_15130, partial [Planctomycetota bacterium]
MDRPLASRSISANFLGSPGVSAPTRTESGRLFRVSRWDAVLVCVAALHGAALLACPSIPMLAIGLWWNSNTVSHHFIHNPFFRSRFANRTFAAYLTVLLGYPFKATIIPTSVFMMFYWLLLYQWLLKIGDSKSLS